MERETIDIKLGKEAEKDENIDHRGRFDFEEFVKHNKLAVVIGALGIIFLGIGLLSTIILSQKPASVEIIADQEASQSGKMMIHVAGAVEKPGLYQLSQDSRVNDALIASGGLNAQADREWFNKNVNLAQKLVDGAKLYFPSNQENDEPGLSSISEPGSVLSSETKINLNTASLTQLDTLPGIGPAYGQRIIDYRTKSPFTKIEDVMKVSGIGQLIFDKIKDQISVF